MFALFLHGGSFIFFCGCDGSEGEEEAGGGGGAGELGGVLRDGGAGRKRGYSIGCAAIVVRAGITNIHHKHGHEVKLCSIHQLI